MDFAVIARRAIASLCSGRRARQVPLPPANPQPTLPPAWHQGRSPPLHHIDLAQLEEPLTDEGLCLLLRVWSEKTETGECELDVFEPYRTCVKELPLRDPEFADAVL